MKKVLLLVAIMATIGAQAQVPEPEFVNSYCIVTGESTYDVLPKENGTIQKHQNKVSKFAKLAGGLANVASSVGVASAVTSGSVSGMMNGVKMVGVAGSVGSAVDMADMLAGAVGMDIVFEGGSSTYQVKGAGKEIQLLIRGENNEKDPMELYRIVRFNTSKKERRIQWMEFKPALIGSAEEKKAGYVTFSGHKYGEQSYMLTIPADEVKKGEYGIFYMNIISATAIPVGTFCIK
ncbi:MAG: hypothetical protein IKT02_07740 [Bacteroidales bacterium]|nr:hypothetical protein [Bacteroidales bacterium]